MAQMTPLRRRLLDDMTVRNLSPATQQSYVYALELLIFTEVVRMSPRPRIAVDPDLRVREGMTLTPRSGTLRAEIFRL
jgi:hypothetical protein